MSVSRQFPNTQSSKFADLASMTREELIAKYRTDKKPQLDEEMLEARADIVRKYRASPGVYPDGIDTPLYRWYVAGDWADDGKFIGLNPPARNAAEARLQGSDDKARRIAIAKEALAGIEVTLGVKPFVVPPQARDDILDRETIIDTKRDDIPSCATCGNPLDHSKRRGRPSRYCSAACKHVAFRAGKA